MNINNRLDQAALESYLIDKLWARLHPEKKEDNLIASVMQMAQNLTGASAASLLLLDEKSQKLYFRYASGPVGNKLARVNINRKSGIAGWIMENGKPLIVNDAEKNSVFYRQIDTTTGFKTRSIIGVPIKIDKQVVGVIEVLNKKDGEDFTRKDLRALLDVARTTARTIELTRMNIDLVTSFRGTVAAVISLADAREIMGTGHSKQVCEYALGAGRILNLSSEELVNIEYAAMFHDIGKLSLPDRLLNKAEDLTEEEWSRIRRHTVTGYILLRDIPFLREAAKLVLYHHERYDGLGYPEGLKGEAIPLGARLIAVADAFSYMTTGHAYQEALTRGQALAELSIYERTQFCPVAVKALREYLDQV